MTLYIKRFKSPNSNEVWFEEAKLSKKSKLGWYQGRPTTLFLHKPYWWWFGEWVPAVLIHTKTAIENEGYKYE